MGEETRTPPDWKTRLWAWWEGYDLPRAQPAPPPPGDGQPSAKPRDAAPGGVADQAQNMSRFGKPLWTATRIEVAEKIWGAGFSTPGGDDFIPYLTKPLGLNPKMSVLDLSAGLGGVARLMAKSYGCWVTGLEASPVLAAAGQERSVMAGLAKQAPISHYDPENFHFSKRFDCIFSKEALVFVKNREMLIDGIERCLKPNGQVLFTDYLLDDPGADGPALRSWRDAEPVEPYPLTLAEVVHSLQQRNLDIRITEDITDRHVSLIVQAIQMLTGFLEKHALDAETKAAVIEEVELWARRVAALQNGLRCYRVFALKFGSGSEA